MKKVIIVILFLSITLGIALTNIHVKKDSSNLGLKFKNIEALAADEGEPANPCSISGTVCILYEPNGTPVFYPGLALGD